MFIGEYIHKMDSRGRVNIPKKLRENLGEKFYLTKGLDYCLFLFPEDEWRRFEMKLKELPLTKKSAREFTRVFFSGACECELDKQGRVNLPQNLVAYSKIEKAISIIGVGERIELWSQERWENYSSEENIDFDDIAEQMAELGI